jgi:outer membrane protein assembly factor BamB
MNSSWPMKSFNAQRIGRTPSSTVDNPGLEKWRFQTFGSGAIDSSAAIDDNGIIYFGSQNFRVNALFPNGTLKWEYKTSQPVFSTPAIAADGIIYIASCDWYLYALHPNGNLKWKFNLQDISFSSPALANNGTIYIGNVEGKLFAMNPDGTCQWYYDFMSGIYGDAALGGDGTIYVGTWDNYLNAINPNGSLKWRFPTGNHVKGVPSIAPDGTIYFGSWDGYLYALYPNGTMRWRCGVGSGSEATPAIAEDGTIYVGGDELYAVYPNGTMRWIFNLGTNRHIFTSCPAIATEGTIYVGVDVGEVTAGEILAVNPNGIERWRKIIATKWVDSSPSIDKDGTVYIGTSSEEEVGPGQYKYVGYLYAFGPLDLNAPTEPVITGPETGTVGVKYDYTFTSTSPIGNQVYYYIEWGDGSSTNWFGPVPSGVSLTMNHSWSKKDSYTIKARAKDTQNFWGPYGTLEVTMPLSYEQPHFRFFEWLFERFPNAFPILRFLLEFNH